MAFALYQSVQSATGTASPLTITKPVSLAVGELMVAVIAHDGSGAASRTGWTQILDTNHADGIHITSLQKIADAADVAATNFAFTIAGVGGHVHGIIARISSTDPSPTDGTASGNGTGTALSIAGFTPTKAAGLMILAAAYTQTSGGGAGSGSSAQAIATDNPLTWTEIYDASTALGGGAFMGMSVAIGNRPKLTATGNATLTYSAATTRWLAHLFNIAPLPNGPFSAAIAFNIPSIRVGMVAALSLVSSLLGATVATAVYNIFTNQKKSTTSGVTNQKKS